MAWATSVSNRRNRSTEPGGLLKQRDDADDISAFSKKDGEGVHNSFVSEPMNFLRRINPFFLVFLLSSLEIGIWLPEHHLLSLASGTVALTGPILLIANRQAIAAALKKERMLFFLLACFMGSVFLSLYFSSNHKVASVFSVKYLFQILIFLGIFVFIARKGDEVRFSFLRGLSYFAALNGLLVFYEKLRGPFSAQLIQFFNKSTDVDWSRFSGMFINPNGLGAFEALAVIALVLYGKRMFDKKVLVAVTMLLALTGLFLSASLNGVINLVVFFVGYFFFFGGEKLKKFRVYIILFALLSFLFVHKELYRRVGPLMETRWDHQNFTLTLHVLDSLKERFNLWHVAGVDIEKHKALGLGAGVFIFSHSILSTVNKEPVVIGSGQLNAHNFEINMTVSFGFLGLSIFFLFVIRSIFLMMQRRDGSGIVLFSFLFALQQIDCFLDSYFPWMIAFWGLMAVAICKGSVSQRQNAPRCFDGREKLL